jgi:RNA polymerase sigma factor (TIGR02999 family)
LTASRLRAEIDEPVSASFLTPPSSAEHRVSPDLEPLVQSAERGDPLAQQKLFDVLYRELRRIAEREIGRVGARGMLSPTTVLHETYIAMADRRSVVFADEARFMAYAAKAMRGLVIDYARRSRAVKHGGEFHFTSCPTDILPDVSAAAELERIGAVLEELAAVDARLAEVVDLKFFCGFSFAEIAAMRNQSERTVQRDWDKARVFLFHSLLPHGGDG